MVKYEIRRTRSKSQPFRFRIVHAKNGKVLASSETYARKTDVRKAILLIDPDANIIDLT